ncbi:Oidioi.mRNA.OKI2018_I69.PAR.g13058.t1.cds [Oikopleura dioica]|uniref:Protein YIF1 n=1 Tax=Oikopleura dioica TaxID=34765 RepID=A0ABN7S2Z5_OIKDI|nr:Oidioi.mRNA.OKI2018_I69.PAR.g13058.t1.cds [Oikopleura dioica]
MSHQGFEDYSNYYNPGQFDQNSGYQTNLNNPYENQQQQGYSQNQYQQQPQQQQQQVQQTPTTQASFAPNPMNFIPNQQIGEMGLQMGQQFLNQHTDQLKAKAQQYIPTTRLRYLFAVDNAYVASKLKSILLPFFKSEWHTKFQNDANNPVCPRDDENAHDMYIPTMGFITYILLAGYSIGLHGEFNPEQLGEYASGATGWIVLEVLVTLMVIFLLQIQSDLGYLDIIAFAGYKFVPIILALTCGLVSNSHAVFLGALIYGSIALCTFLVRSLKVRVQSNSAAAHGQYAAGDTRKQYLTLGIAVVQPLLCYVLTRHLSPSD